MPSLYNLNETLVHNWWMIVLRGAVAVLFGIVAFATPVTIALSLVFLFAAYLLIDGVFAIISAVRAARHHGRWGPLTFEGIVDILAAVLVVLWPGMTLLGFVLLAAAWALISGFFMVRAAFHLQADHGRWWLGFGGIVSILFGIALGVAPLAGVVVLTWWLGAYALVFGVALLVLGLKLYAHRHDHPWTAARAA